MNIITACLRARLRNRALTAILFSVFSVTGYSQAVVKLPVIDRQDIRFVRISVGGEPFKKRVLAVSQDNYGFMWLGTDDGLYRYDGYTLKPYRHDPNNPRSLSDNAVYVIYKDRSGIIWVGTSYGGLNRYDPVHDVFTRYGHDPKNNRSLRDDHVWCIYQDRAGALWIGTSDGLNRLDVESGRFFHYPHPPENNLGSNAVQAVYEDDSGNLLVGGARGLYKLDRSSGRLSQFSSSPVVSGGLDKDYVLSLKQDRSGALWVPTLFGNGLVAFDTTTGESSRYLFSLDGLRNRLLAGVTRVHEDRNGVLWIGTVRDGLLKFNREQKNFIRYSTRADGEFPDRIWDLLEDAEGNMWVANEAGVSRFQTAPVAFISYRHEPHNPNSLRNNRALSVHADARGFLWIGTEAGLHRLDRKTGQIVIYQHDPKDPTSLSYNEVSAIVEDGSGGLWIGTYGGGLNRFDRASGRFFAYRHNPKDPQSLSNDLVLALLPEPGGRLWVGTQGSGLNRFDTATSRFTIYRNDPRDPHSLSEDHPRVIFTDRAGTLWVGTNGGLNRFERGTERFTVYLHDNRNSASLSNEGVNSIHEDRQGTLWIGTRRGLNRFDRTRGSFVRFGTQDGLANDSIEGIEEDRHGKLWLTTHEGLSSFEPTTKAVRNYSESDGLLGGFANPTGVGHRSCITPENELVFGSPSGVTVFDPDRLSGNAVRPPVVLTDFLLFNKPVPLSSNSPLQQPIWATRSLTLNHDQSIFTIQFAALSYVSPERNRYRYRLESLEKEWNEVDGERRVATYTSLPAGQYVFRVQGSNNSMVWNEDGANLAVTVLPPWWASWQFRSIVVLSMAALVLGIHRLRVRSLQTAAAKLQIQVSERTRELRIAKDAAEAANRAKSVFLAKMSHELRTPLNAILGFSGMVMQDAKLPEKHRKDLAIVGKSGEHLLGLIDEVLDMAKIETGGSVVESSSIDLHALVNDTANMLRERAQTKNLELLVDISSRAPQFVRSDAGKLRQVLTNLIGNALKYTDEGSVVVRLNARPGDGYSPVTLIFDVEDTGIGIAPEDQVRIFEPFVQLGGARTRKGTGLGLSISRHFVELMGGTIQVESTLGRGSRFQVELPTQIAEVSEVMGEPARVEQVIGIQPGQPEYRILIVEDHRENWLLLQRLLETVGFHVRVAEDGAYAVESFKAWRPHFIWMDVRLPAMSGLEAARRIRELEDEPAVKIVALTASAFASQREEALAAGFDDFLRKPYRPTEIFDCMGLHLGVRYLYAQTAQSTVSDVPATLRPEDLAALPTALRDELETAVLSLDPTRVAPVISRISDQNASLGSALGRFADELAYSPILSALKSCRSSPMEAGSWRS